MNSLEVWKGSLANRSESAKYQYMHYFKLFSDWAGKTPDELRELKWQEDKSNKPWERNQIENLVREYLNSIEEKYSCSTRKAALNAIRSFFSANGLTLNLTRNDRPTGCARGSRVPKREEIKTMVEATDSLRNRALILFLKDSGLRESDVAKLKWKDLKDYGDGFMGCEIQTKKRGTLARAFIGQETTEILMLYKKKRTKGTSKVPAEKNIEEHPIFALYDRPEKALEPRVMSWEIKRVVQLTDIEGVSGHGLRKFWEQNMKVEHEAYQKQINGRALNDVERAYFWKETDELFEMYKENYSNLRIFQPETEINFEELKEKIREELRAEYESKLQQQIENVVKEELKHIVPVEVEQEYRYLVEDFIKTQFNVEPEKVSYSVAVSPNSKAITVLGYWKHGKYIKLEQPTRIVIH